TTKEEMPRGGPDTDRDSFASLDCCRRSSRLSHGTLRTRVIDKADVQRLEGPGTSSEADCVVFRTSGNRRSAVRSASDNTVVAPLDMVWAQPGGCRRSREPCCKRARIGQRRTSPAVGLGVSVRTSAPMRRHAWVTRPRRIEAMRPVGEITRRPSAWMSKRRSHSGTAAGGPVELGGDLPVSRARMRGASLVMPITAAPRQSDEGNSIWVAEHGPHRARRHRHALSSSHDPRTMPLRTYCTDASRRHQRGQRGS
ncbi:MAG: hypothetical protein QOF81_2138, partial [Acidimicrobiaceae bacterium]|nr:hypothetical protein [Acidimicrobiaceae bacterium]